MRYAVFCLAACAFALSCLAQDSSTGAIHGTICHQSGSRIPGASIVLLNNATGFRHERTSDSTGRFAFELLPPGDYSARAVAEAMSPQLSPHLTVNVGGASEIEFKLTVAGPHENITVSAQQKQVAFLSWVRSTSTRAKHQVRTTALQCRFAVR